MREVRAAAGGAARHAGAGQHLGRAVQDTSLVSVIAVGELAYTAMRIRSQSFRVLEMLTAMARSTGAGLSAGKARRLAAS